MALPLEGIRVLDLGNWQHVPAALTLLGEWGAEVIKVETPESARVPIRERHDAYFLAFDRGKKSITLDLHQPAGREILLKLVRTADIVGENRRPGSLEQMGLGYEALKEVNPRIIYASGTGFGSEGPRRLDTAFDFVGQAMGGMMNLVGPRDEIPNVVGFPVADYVASMHVVIGILVALQHRNLTGEGQRIETSLLGSSIHSQPWSLMLSYTEGKSRTRNGRYYGATGPAKAPLPMSYRSSDGYVVLAGPMADDKWANFCVIIDRDDLLTDPRFVTEASRIENSADILQIMDDVLPTRTSSEWVEALRAVDIIAAPVLDHDQILTDPQVLANDFIVHVDHPVLGRFPTFGHPVKFSGFDVTIPAAPSELGADTDALLQELGCSDEDIAGLRARGVV